MRAGLVPYLRESTAVNLIPVYVNTYGDEWATGSRGAVAQALWDALEPHRAQLRLSTFKQLEDALEDAWRRVFEVLGRRCLLIFDQFDDYQLNYRKNFLLEGAWINASDLRANNAFWDQVGTALIEGWAPVPVCNSLRCRSGAEINECFRGSTQPCT